MILLASPCETPDCACHSDPGIADLAYLAAPSANAALFAAFDAVCNLPARERPGTPVAARDRDGVEQVLCIFERGRMKVSVR